MNLIFDFMQNISRRSPGLVLVAISAFLIFQIIGYKAIDGGGSASIYLGYGFACALAVSGMFLLLRTERSDFFSMTSSETTDLQHAVRQLSQNYDVLRKQATSGFILAGTFMALGIGVILVGAVGDLFGFTREGSNLTTIAGVVVEAISGMGLYLFKQTFNQLNSTSDKLHQTWKILTAFEMAESLPENEKSKTIASLINRLVDAEIKSNNSIQPTANASAD